MAVSGCIFTCALFYTLKGADAVTLRLTRVGKSDGPINNLCVMRCYGKAGEAINNHMSHVPLWKVGGAINNHLSHASLWVIPCVSYPCRANYGYASFN